MIQQHPPKFFFMTFGTFLKDQVSIVSKYTGTSKFFPIFWILGPFFSLIERSPADFWISLIALAYLIKCKEKTFRPDFSDPFVISLFVFGSFLFLSAALSPIPIVSLTEALAWMRFPIFAFAVVFWIGRDPELVELYLKMIFLAIFIMFIILSCEIAIKGQEHWGRLSWPFGDLVSGNYLNKIGLPTIIFACFVAVNNHFTKYRVAMVAYILVFLFFSIMCGERINFLITFCSLMVCLLFQKNRLLNLGMLFGSLCLCLAIASIIDSAILNRFGVSFIGEFPFSANSSYFKTIYPAILIFQKEMLFGIGPATYRFLCTDFLSNYPDLIHYCNNHPHNYLAQLAAETGIIGLLFGSLFMVSVIARSFSFSSLNGVNEYQRLLFVVPLAFFWPLRRMRIFWAMEQYFCVAKHCVCLGG